MLAIVASGLEQRDLLSVAQDTKMNRSCSELSVPLRSYHFFQSQASD